MALTAKPQSTIAYNTPEFLKRKLKELYDAQKLEKYYFILHDKDVIKETGEPKKQHFHVWVKPNRRLDTMDLAKAFIELDPENPGKPLKCRPFQDSQLEHWLRYTIHDPVYLAMHNLEDDGRHEYTLEEYGAFDFDVLQEDYQMSSSVLQIPKEKQRDIMAELILKSHTRHNASTLYKMALERGLKEGYWSFQNALTRLAFDHNKDLEVEEAEEMMKNVIIQQSIDNAQLENGYVEMVSKIEEADITGVARVKIGEKVYVINRTED